MFCHNCKVLLENESLSFCPNCGTSLSQEIISGSPQSTMVKHAKFNSSSEDLFQSCISSLNELGITINKIDEAAKYIETANVNKSPIGTNNRFPIFRVRVTEDPNTISTITVAIFTNNVEVATDTFNSLIYVLNTKLNQEPIEQGEAISSEMQALAMRGNSPQNRKVDSDTGAVRTISIIIGILGGIWTAILLVEVLYIDSRLSQAGEIGFGLGALIVARITPSIQISGIIGLLSIVITLLLLVRPSKSRIVGLLALSVVNILLSLWVVNQMPQLLYELFVVLVIGMLFNLVTLIYSAAVYKKVH